MGRSPCCAKEGLNRGAWTAIEDKILADYIKVHGEGRWRNLPKRAGLKRCGKSCRLRWLNYLRPDIKRGNITLDEEELIIRLHNLLGNRWSLIAGRLPGRTDNEIKNYWNTNLSKRTTDRHRRQNTSYPWARNELPRSSSNQIKRSEVKVRPLSQDIDADSTIIPAPAPEPKPANNIHPNVVRTKAVRCTKVFIDPPQQQQPLMLRPSVLSPPPPPPAPPGGAAADPKALQGVHASCDEDEEVEEAAENSQRQQPYNFGLDDHDQLEGSGFILGSSSSDIDLMGMDFGDTMGDFNFSDLLLDSNTLSDICFDLSPEEAAASNDNELGDDRISPMPTAITAEEQPIIFTDEMAENYWTSKRDFAALNTGSGWWE